MSIKQWKLNHISAEKSRILSSEYDLPPLVSDVLVGRGLDTPQAVEDFFSADSDFLIRFRFWIWTERQNVFCRRWNVMKK